MELREEDIVSEAGVRWNGRLCTCAFDKAAFFACRSSARAAVSPPFESLSCRKRTAAAALRNTMKESAMLRIVLTTQNLLNIQTKYLRIAGMFR